MEKAPNRPSRAIPRAPLNFVLAGALTLALAFHHERVLAAVPLHKLDTIEQIDREPSTALPEIKEVSYYRVQEVGEYLSDHYGVTTEKFFVVDTKEQIILVAQWDEERFEFNIIVVFPVSTARKGLGNATDSGQTPTGVFRLGAVDGKGQPIGTILTPDQYGDRTKSFSSGDGHPLMTTRVMVLDGMESTNRNTAERDIALHGTNREQNLGNPDSGGCIRTDNESIIFLAAYREELSRQKKRAYLVVIDPNDIRFNVPPIEGVYDLSADKL